MNLKQLVESASAGATGAGSIAVAPAVQGTMKKRPGIYDEKVEDEDEEDEIIKELRLNPHFVAFHESHSTSTGHSVVVESINGQKYQLEVTPMKLDDVICEGALSPEMALRKLNLVTNELGGIVNTATEETREALKWNDPTRSLPIIGKVARWVTDNYQSSRGGTGHNIESLFQELQKKKQFRDTSQSAMQQINIIMDKKTKQSKLVQLQIIIDAITKIQITSKKTQLSPIVSKSNLSAAHRLPPMYTSFRELFSELASIKRADIGIDPDAEANRRDKSAAKQTKSVGGQQSAQAEKVVAQVLSTLDPKIAARIRQDIAKADNKLAALQREMKKHGLIETYRRIRKKILKENDK